MAFYYPLEKSSWLDFTLVIPSVSVGNVGQLAADLIISSLSMKKVGIVFDESVTPVIGNDPFQSCLSDRIGALALKSKEQATTPTLMTSCEVYESEPHRLVVLQQRAPLVHGLTSRFLRLLIDFIKTHRFSNTVVLCGTHAHERLDAQISGDQARFVRTSSFDESTLGGVIDRLGWTELEARPPRPDLRDKDVNPYLPGGGVAKRLYRLFQKEGLPAIVLMIFCAEGDNIPEAIALSDRVDALLSLFPVDNEGDRKWRIPASWSALFGNRSSDLNLVFG